MVEYLQSKSPVIGMYQEDRTEFVNTRTYWSLTVEHNDQTYELRVKHQHPADVLTFLSHAADTRDARTLVTKEDFEFDADMVYTHEDGVASLADARDRLEQMGTYVMLEADAAVLRHLRRHWDAFVVLFNPAINSF